MCQPGEKDGKGKPKSEKIALNQMAEPTAYSRNCSWLIMSGHKWQRESSKEAMRGDDTEQVGRAAYTFTREQKGASAASQSWGFCLFVCLLFCLFFLLALISPKHNNTPIKDSEAAVIALPQFPSLCLSVSHFLPF